MFGIEDPLICLPYLLFVVCVLFAAWYGIRYWNKDNDKDESQ
jgi:hypothetical protein